MDRIYGEVALLNEFEADWCQKFINDHDMCLRVEIQGELSGWFHAHPFDMEGTGIEETWDRAALLYNWLFEKKAISYSYMSQLLYDHRSLAKRLKHEASDGENFDSPESAQEFLDFHHVLQDPVLYISPQGNSFCVDDVRTDFRATRLVVNDLPLGRKIDLRALHYVREVSGYREYNASGMPREGHVFLVTEKQAQTLLACDPGNRFWITTDPSEWDADDVDDDDDETSECCASAGLDAQGSRAHNAVLFEQTNRELIGASMGRGGIDTWEVLLLKFGSGKVTACQAILDSRYKDAETGDLEAWYQAIISALTMLADSSIYCSLATSNHSDVYLSDDVACSLLELSDQFELEEELNTDGNYTYVQEIDPVKTASELSAFVRNPEGSSVADAIQESAFLEEEWVPDLQSLIDFLKDETNTEGPTLYLQVVTAN